MPFPVNTVDGLFHNGDPSTNTPGTVIDADWLNAVQAAVIAMGTVAKTVAATYPITNYDGVLFCDTTASDFTITLPVIAGLVAGKRFIIKNVNFPADAHTVSLVAADGKTIDGELQIDINAREKITVVFDGLNWETI